MINFIGLFYVVCIVCIVLQYYIYKNKKNETVSVQDLGSPHNNNSERNFVLFQRQYLLIYLLAMAADWLQGPYVYALYESYGYTKQEIAILFIIGFFSSMIFGVIVGPIADKYGRKLMAMVFGVFYGLSCATKLFNNFSILLIGRLLGGIATSLLFSVFESWMMYEHKSRGFSNDLLSNTFYLSTFLNGVIAIACGLWASESASRWGYVSPFMWACLLLVIVTGLIYMQWNENYIESNNSLIVSYKESFQFLKSDQKVIILGLIQTLFESSMYIFIFMWTPTLIESLSLQLTSTTESIELPFGLIFASFMVCVMIGSSIFNIMLNNHKNNNNNNNNSSSNSNNTDSSLDIHKSILKLLLVVASICFIIPYLSKDPFIIYLAFLTFEVCCGIYYPCLGSIRGPLIPEAYRATIMNYYRVPLNFIVVVILINISNISTQTIFFLCSLGMILAVGLQTKLVSAMKINN